MAVALMAVVAALLAAAGAWAFLPRFLQIIEGSGFVRSNFLGRPVPAAAGAAIALIYGAILLFMLAADAGVRMVGRASEEGGLGALSAHPLGTAVSLVTFSMALVGLADDVFGDRSATGLGGHLNRLRAGSLTTGAVKALFGGVVGLAAAALVSSRPADLILNALLIPLLANALNLLDVRPGRAVKGFLGLMALLWAVTPAHDVWPYVLPLLAVVAVYGPYDLRARAMLGDAGANLLGGVAGVAAAASLSLLARTALLSVLVALHLYAERRSLGELIEQVPPLRWLDQWGRE